MTRGTQAATERAAVTVLEIPMLPDIQTLGGNSRAHWAKKHKAFQTDKNAWYAEMSAVQPLDWHIIRFTHLKLSVELVFKEKRNRDQDNVMHALKALFDALVALRRISNDDTAHLTTTLKITVDPKRAPLTVLTFEEAT